MDYKEWKLQSDFNPFNTFKILKHVDYWKQIDLENKVVPPPIAVTIDPINACNYSCVGCNANRAMKMQGGFELHPSFCTGLIEFLKNWGVQAVTFAGGGEPLMSRKALKQMLYDCKTFDVQFGLISNGYFLTEDYSALLKETNCRWIGVSVDASTPQVYAYIKNTDSKHFNVVIDNIQKCTSLGHDVTYKYLVNKYNIADIYSAVKIAKESGCKRIHVRPIGNAWYEDKKPIFSIEDVELALAEITKAREDFEDEKFKVFGITHKFDKNWKVNNYFDKCWATFMYLVIEPYAKISTCCDNRGNPDMVLAKDLQFPNEILEYWGSERHIQMFNDINVSKCPRCTFTIHNQCYESCILKDSMMFNFI